MPMPMLRNRCRDFQMAAQRLAFYKHLVIISKCVYHFSLCALISIPKYVISLLSVWAQDVTALKILKTMLIRDVFRAQLNIYDEAFLR